jgi:hypothetical protein
MAWPSTVRECSFEFDSFANHISDRTDIAGHSSCLQSYFLIELILRRISRLRFLCVPKYLKSICADSRALVARVDNGRAIQFFLDNFANPKLDFVICAKCRHVWPTSTASIRRSFLDFKWKGFFGYLKPIWR